MHTIKTCEILYISYIITTVCLFVRLSVRRRFHVLIDAVEPARTVGFEKPDSARTVRFGKRDSEKRAARQGMAGQGAGQGPSIRLSCRAGQGAGPCGKGRGQIKSKK
jgi:hypothetical protein